MDTKSDGGREASHCLTSRLYLTEVLAMLQYAYVPLALVTSSWPQRIAIVLRQHGLDGVFDAIVCRDDVALGKPAPGCYRLAAERLGVDIASCLVFEDSPSGVQAAVQSGAGCVGIGDDTSLQRHGAMALYRDFHALHPRLAATPGHTFDSGALAGALTLAEPSGAKRP
ncbi:HAD family hydrolase [Neisseriaceae bacterium JH1-16]|nr:HAD family hydrolase [Neisseriaceae bacterium JH1-16]